MKVTIIQDGNSCTLENVKSVQRDDQDVTVTFQDSTSKQFETAVAVFSSLDDDASNPESTS